MAKRQSGLEDVVDISAKLPWWAGVTLALLAYGIFHWMAGWKTPAPTGLKDMQGAIVVQVLRAGSLFLQFLVPVAFLLGAALSALGRRKRAGLLVRTAASGDSRSFLDMSWQEFEMLVGEAFRGKGFEVRETGAAGPDGGVDLVLTAGSEKYLVQCKRWRALKVDVAVVRELYGVIAATGASGGFVVSAGQFTKDAAEFAKGRNIELIGERQLMSLVKEASTGKGGRKDRRPATDPLRIPAPGKVRPPCPRCGSAMTERVAKRGAKAGNPFWGCTNYPKCYGTVPIAS